MFHTPLMSIPLTFSHITFTYSTPYFNLIIHFLFLLNFIFHFSFTIILIHLPHFLRILLCPIFSMPQTNITCQIFSPIQFQYSPTPTFSAFLLFNFFSTLSILNMVISFQMLCPSIFSNITLTHFTVNIFFFLTYHILNIYITSIPLSIGRMKGKAIPLIQKYLQKYSQPKTPTT